MFLINPCLLSLKHENIQERVRNEDRNSNNIKNNEVDLSWIEAKIIKATNSFDRDNNHICHFHKDSTAVFQLDIYDINTAL